MPTPDLHVLARRSSSAFAALLALAVAAFWPGYLSRPLGGIDRLTHLHAAAAVAWMVLLVAQPWLVTTRRRMLHRRLGQAAWLLAPAVAISGLLVAHLRFSAMDAAAFAREAPGLYLPMSMALLFALSSALALATRRTPAVHARLMVCSGLALLDPVTARLLFHYLPPLPHDFLYAAVSFTIVDLVLWRLVSGWRVMGPPGRLLPAAFASFVLVQIGWFTLAWTGVWHGFAEAFVRLPLT